MKTIERIVGNAIAGMLIAIFILSILVSLFRLVFRDGRGMGMYGSRGEFYMAE